ncbi:uncharacterized protein LOC111082327 isoform X1 [Drosophila obscura]|uniref:uncharacterized protein LOC111082327 isoform X1 n=1 Tax=Drosophila obscura TaxID=7282 RepID=UPI000B9FC580|nr:uncharacterized protein LOC111082327 isoform X1 [Drosophila obscura]XP_022234218.1 uncharacterized protein LOC111082327 isoform X1 [Drosophila obscura]XP_022234219.1 uncharacterized protein LOC111082327 isoform X1 [Drosophila obscura]XP_022234220.1 uncharacterized protein LOC111082327 isoform X1 [Drosophila obscura]XP_022234221.1 uncharacterized protein LOC111082327 isoform X1 [Drosophila obscura]
MQYTKCKTMLMLAVLSLSLTLSLSAPSPQQLNTELESTLQDSGFSSSDPDLNPINAEEVLGDGQERNKRKLPDATFEAKNAVLGFVFGKIDNFLDTKTRVIEQLDRANIEKNKQWDIKSPVPIKDFQTLITAVVSPKIRSLGNIANDITTGVLTTITAFSGSSAGNGNANAGLGNVVSKFLSFSGPILQGSSGGVNGIGGATTPSPDSDEAGY